MRRSTRACQVGARAQQIPKILLPTRTEGNGRPADAVLQIEFRSPVWGAQIRPADAADAAVIAALGRITFGKTFGYLFRDHQDDLRAYLDRTFDVAKIERSLGKPENADWLAFSAGLPVGYAKLKQPSSSPAMAGQYAAQLQKIYVLHQFLGQRIGRALLGQAMCEAAVKGALVWLEVLEENERAVSFYRTHGFAVVGPDTYAIGAQRFTFRIMAGVLV